MRRGKTGIAVLAVLIAGLCSCFLECRSESSVNLLLGVAPQDESFYKGEVLKCRDENQRVTFKKSQLNDNFCDCPDGADEPGTSACPRGKFYCVNAGHSPLILYSSRVNDGICDCCDGSDEYDGQIKCPNTCWEAGKIARDKLAAKIAVYKEGVSVRARLVLQAQSSYSGDQAELSKLRDEESLLSDLVKQLKERKELIDKAEEKERLQREKEEKERKDAEEKVSQHERSESADHSEPNLEHDTDAVGTLDDSNDYQAESTEHDAPVANTEEPSVIPDKPDDDNEPPVGNEPFLDESESNHGTPGDIDTPSAVEADDVQTSEQLSKEDLGRIVASRWTGNAEKSGETVDNAIADEEEISNEGRHAGYTSETDDEHGKYDDGDEEDDSDDSYRDDADDSYRDDSDDAYVDPNPFHQRDSFEDEQSIDPTSSSVPWLSKIQQKIRNILHSVNIFQAPLNISDAANVRKEYEDANSKLSKLQSRISSLTKKLNHDFGSAKEFYSFYDQCFEAKQNKYVYKICPFKEAMQKDGHSSTRLGAWEKFDDSYKVMIFSGGDGCWNGPSRSMRVKLRCGAKNEVTDVDEPSRCEYTALLTTPAVCLDAKLKELEVKLEDMKRERPVARDEL